MPDPLDLPSSTLDSGWMNREWTSEYLCEWADDPNHEPLRQLAEHCTDLCEEYDLRLCHVRNWWGVAIPVTPDQRRRSTAYAREQMESLGWLAQRLEYTPIDWQRAIQDANVRLDRLMREQARDRGRVDSIP